MCLLTTWCVIKINYHCGISESVLIDCVCSHVGFMVLFFCIPAIFEWIQHTEKFTLKRVYFYS